MWTMCKWVFFQSNVARLAKGCETDGERGPGLIKRLVDNEVTTFGGYEAKTH